MDHYQQASRVLADVMAKKGSIKTLALAKDIRNKVCKNDEWHARASTSSPSHLSCGSPPSLPKHANPAIRASSCSIKRSA
jgi:hypothetical protein